MPSPMQRGCIGLLHLSQFARIIAIRAFYNGVMQSAVRGAERGGGKTKGPPTAVRRKSMKSKD